MAVRRDPRAAAPPRRRSCCAIGQRVRKRQPDGGLIGLGTSPCEHDPLALAARDRLRVRREQGHRVRVQRPAEELLGGRQLDDLAEVHDRDPVGDVADDGEVVGDEEVGQVELLLQLDEQVEHLRLDRDVERGHRLVGDDELRAQHEGAGEADPLALAAAELVRVAPGRLGAEADALEHLDHGLVAPLALEPVDPQALADEVAHLHARVERADGVLEDDLHVPAHRLQLGAAETPHVDAVELDLAGGRLEQPQQRAAERRLAAAGLADEADRLAAEDVEVDAVHRLELADGPLQDPLAHGEVLLHPARLQQDVRRLAAGAEVEPVVLRSTSCDRLARVRGTRRPSSHSQHADSCGGTGRSGGSSSRHLAKT